MEVNFLCFCVLPLKCTTLPVVCFSDRPWQGKWQYCFSVFLCFFALEMCYFFQCYSVSMIGLDRVSGIFSVCFYDSVFFLQWCFLPLKPTTFSVLCFSDRPWQDKWQYESLQRQYDQNKFPQYINFALFQKIINNLQIFQNLITFLIYTHRMLIPKLSHMLTHDQWS